MASAPQVESRVPRGVPPLRAGQGTSFLLRRLHSLSGIVPVGAFLVEHFVSNAFATNGPFAYAQQVKFLSGLPFRLWLEVLGIYLPLAFHGLYGIYIWWRGDNNLPAYGYAGNWGYTLQRYTGLIAFAYIFWHTYTMRFTGVELVEHSGAAFWKVQSELMHPWAFAIYIVGILAASWHFGYGLFLFAAKWGIVTGERARKRVQIAAIGVAVVFMAVGIATAYDFVYKFPKQEFNPQWSQPSNNSAPVDSNQG